MKSVTLYELPYRRHLGAPCSHTEMFCCCTPGLLAKTALRRSMLGGIEYVKLQQLVKLIRAQVRTSLLICGQLLCV